jgi:AraC-like DNA-binding protein
MDSKLLPFFFFSTGLAGLGVSFILISSRKYLYQNFYLSLCIFSLSICAIYNFCYTVGSLPDFPFLFIIAKAIIYLIAPSAYLYIRNIFQPSNMYRKYDWLNFIPFMVVLLALTNESLRNPQAIQKALADSSINWFVNVRHAGLYFNLSIAKAILWLTYTVLQSICIIKFERKRHLIPTHYNYRLVNWIKIFNITLIVLFISLLVQRIISVSFISVDFVSDTTMSFILLLVLSFLIANPHILYSLEQAGLNLANYTHPHVPSVANHSNDINDKDLAIKQLFNSKRKDEYLLILDNVISQTRPYLNKGITVKDLSEQTGIPAHHLSNLISSEFNLHFQDFINLRRIEYLKNHIDDLEWKQLTLEGICWEIGFTSRTTFFRAFIKFTGLSPSEYFNTLKKHNHSA